MIKSKEMIIGFKMKKAEEFREIKLLQKSVRSLEAELELNETEIEEETGFRRWLQGNKRRSQVERDEIFVKTNCLKLVSVWTVLTMKAGNGFFRTQRLDDMKVECKKRIGIFFRTIVERTKVKDAFNCYTHQSKQLIDLSPTDPKKNLQTPQLHRTSEFQFLPYIQKTNGLNLPDRTTKIDGNS
jgi:hypothetical protein